MKKKAVATLPVPGQLGQILNVTGVRVVLNLTREDGEALDSEDMLRARAACAAWVEREKRVAVMLDAASALVPASMSKPSSAIMAAVANGGGLREASKPVKSRSRAAAKKPSR